MRFSEYMNAWLYGKEGYYANYKEIGKGGDFYTSVSTSKFFGGTVAKHIVSLIEEGFLDEDAVICEIGAQHGYFLADVVEFIYTLAPRLLQTLRFAIVERFETLQEQQKRYFQESFGDAVTLIHYKSLGELTCKSAFFAANEIFDAFGCELLYEGKIASVTDHRIKFDIMDEAVLKKAQKYSKTKGEIAVGYEAFAKEMYAAAKQFEFVSFDYGEMTARNDFSLRVYKEHQVYPFFDDAIDTKELYAKADITYDVIFAQVKDAFLEAGCDFIELKSQMSALVEMGILELLEMLQKNADEKIYHQELQKVKMLITPDFLGERFKMIRFRKVTES
jgi:SAM-dependent MidA family methyltransferase